MNGIVLACATVALIVFGSLILTKQETKVVPYFVPERVLGTKFAPQTVFHEPPALDQVRKDLGGKVVMINGRSHQFAGPEINSVAVSKCSNTHDSCIAVDVNICADTTIVQRVGLISRGYSHENVRGTLRVHYIKQDDKWVCQNVENVNLQKVIKPNAKAPPQSSRVWRYEN